MNDSSKLIILCELFAATLLENNYFPDITNMQQYM